MPFAARIAEVEAERDEYVRAGDVLMTADSIDAAEVEAQFALGRIRSLISAEVDVDTGFDPTDPKLVERFGITAEVNVSDVAAAWPARVARMSSGVDAKTRTVGVVTVVDQPYERARPGVRPPLVKGLFVQVELRGAKREDLVPVPRFALHAGRVYVADGDDRLRIREVEVELHQPEFVGVSAGLEPGDRLIVSDVSPAIEGMLLEPVEDARAAAALAEMAGVSSP